MVYESDYYTSRRPYSRPTVSSYSVTRREVPWEKVPFVPRPSLIADPITAFGKHKPKKEVKISILEPKNRIKIEPENEETLPPIEPYISTRDLNRTRILNEVRRFSELREQGGPAAISTDKNSMDVILARVHNNVPVRQNHRRIYFLNDPTYLSYRGKTIDHRNEKLYKNIL